MGGGTRLIEVSEVVGLGPSPRGRGNQDGVRAGLADMGTIPAWAGEPMAGVNATGRMGDHPRVGGGTPSGRPGDPHGEGPSPRGRGNPIAPFAQTLPIGTIPAWAGEPPAHA